MEEGIDSRSDQSESRVVPDAEKKKLSATSERSVDRRFNNKPPLICFFCFGVDSKHFLADCDNFKTLSPKLKRKTVIDAKRYLNCLSLEHFVSYVNVTHSLSAEGVVRSAVTNMLQRFMNVTQLLLKISGPLRMKNLRLFPHHVVELNLLAKET